MFSEESKKGQAPYNLRHRLRFALSLASVRRGAAILDIGCAEGHFIRSLYKQYSPAICIGLDINLAALIRAKDPSCMVDFVCASATNLPFKPRIFDIVFMLESLQFLPPDNQRSSLIEIAKILVYAGSLILSFPSNLQSNTLFRVRGTYHVDLSALLQAAKTKGIQIVAVRRRATELFLLSVFLDSLLTRFVRLISFRRLTCTKTSKIQTFLSRIQELDFKRESARGVVTFVQGLLRK